VPHAAAWSNRNQKFRRLAVSSREDTKSTKVDSREPQRATKI
jgi:hypothetical protein